MFDYCREDKTNKLEFDLKRARDAGEKGVPVSVIPGKENPNMPRILYSAETIPKLAEYMYDHKEDRDRFMETVNRYNSLCKDGRDVDFGKDSALLHEIKEPPFYAVGQMKDSHHYIGQSFKILVTVGGLMIGENQQVLNEAYEPIPGLFATGNSSGCRFGFQYTTSISGQSISVAQTLGREVGKYLAFINDNRV